MARRPRGQALAEFALVFPIAMSVIFGIIVFGIWVFYQQQLTNVAREGARFAAIHSSTAICPTSSWRDPQAPLASYRMKPLNCDGPDNPSDSYPWPNLTAHARAFAWGMNPGAIHINACWSGHRPFGGSPTTNADFPAFEPDGLGGVVANEFIQCTIDGHDPETNSQDLECRARMTTLADDPASDVPDNQVTVYACFIWRPPLAGVLMIPSQVTMKAVISEVIHRQQ
jgi:hypothetical protein